MRLYYGGPRGHGEREMGSVPENGRALTFDTRDSHAWMVRSWGGVTMLELPPLAGRASSTVDIRECALQGARRQLHQGWR